MMTMEFWLAMSALAVLAVIATIAVLDTYGFTDRPVVRKLWCAWQERSVVAKFRSSPFSVAYRDVESCSAFPGEAALACGKKCLGRDRR
jgi:hypothetical protein